MLNKLKDSKKSEGFTIIEVMIVLAIAGLILLIVFLAIPALQRGGRNTQRKNDASNISSAIATYKSNTNGALPAGLGNGTAGSVDVCKTGGTASGALAAACTGNFESTKVGFYTAASVYVATAAAGSFAAPTVDTAANASATKVSTETVIVELKQKCGDTNAGEYSSRSVAVWYATESNSGNGGLQCIDS